MLPGLKRRGVVESWREHTPGSIVVKLAPTTALFTAPKRRRGGEQEKFTSSGSALAGLERDTLTLLRQLALMNLDALGVTNDEPFVRKEMERTYSILVAAIPASERSDRTLRQAVENAIDDAAGGERVL